MSDIGILGGTFDPIHNGHLLLGRQALDEYDLDKVWFMPSGQPPHKKDHVITDVSDRCEMVRLAIADEPGFIMSDFEVSRNGYSYTADTIKLLKEEYPDDVFYFIIGADSLFEIETWYHPEEILSEIEILVADREYAGDHLSVDEQIDYLSEKYPCTIERLHCEQVDISSEEIRLLVSDEIEVDDLLPEPVAEYIKTHHLYEEA